MDDVHKALSTLKSAPVKQPSRVNENIADLNKKVKDFASMLGKRTGRPGTGGVFKPPHDGKKSLLDRLKERTKCNACGKKGHWTGDSECKEKESGTNDEEMDTSGGSQDEVPSQRFPRRDQ